MTRIQNNMLKCFFKFVFVLFLKDSFSAVSKPTFARYQNKILTTRKKALDESYKNYILLHRSDFNISATFVQHVVIFTVLSKSLKKTYYFYAHF